ncbi:polysaccharide deacetylase family protein [Treponema zuelzerae]|uniref:Polysaccharide deacetylase family protein n=2 Tax=Teretinema zuelzerae TaxID=156 RepID=A0AAE3JMP9_9SPIR|nr:polysaccharide deacetylase family protein [Teretinema zuelzerae]
MNMKLKIGIMAAAAALVALSSCASKPAAKETAVAEPKKLCALTFDDGPDIEKTALVLDKLDAYGVKATFFVVGQLLSEDTADLAKRMAEAGHEFGNHSWGWESLNEKSPADIRASLDKTAAAIQRYTGQTPRFFRPPNLATSEVLFAEAGLPFAGGVLGMDWAGCGTSAEDRAANVLKGMRDGAIVLLHDVQPYPHPTPEALDILIPELLAQGYELVTLSELFARKGVTPDPREEIMWTYVE